MKKNNIIILSLLFILTIGIVGFNYTNQLVALFVEGAAPNPGHSLSEIEGGAGLATKTYVDDAVPWTVSGTDIYNSNSGNVGIGTITPSAKLHIVGNIITSEPTAANHVVTKNYADNLPTNWPDGGTYGATLRFGETAPYWDAPLTWPGSFHSASECDSIGGTVFDTGSGTICRINSAEIPAGWTQAAHWQRFPLCSWGGDRCGNHLSTGPCTFANEAEVYKRAGSQYSTCGICSYDCAANTPYWNGGAILYYVETYQPTTSNRVEVGIY